MSDAILFLGPAFVLCLVVASLHVYLGMHVLAREVIFVDLALAQLAAFGATVVTTVGDVEAGPVVGVGAFVTSLAGAALFAVAGRARERLSLEAVVGIVYAMATAAMLLVLSRSPHGAEHMNELLAGELLLASWPMVARIAALYAVLGAAQVALRRRFVALSWGSAAGHSGSRGSWADTAWDFGFYALFAITITISVQAIGVLPVFSFLIVPAVVSQLFATSLAARMVVGWTVAIVASLAGLAGSWTLDVPAGASIVVAFGLLLAAASVVALVRRRHVPMFSG